MGDVEVLYKIIKEFRPDVWISIGKKGTSSSNKKLDSLNQEFEVEVISDKLKDEVITLFPMKQSISIKVAGHVEKYGGKALLNLRQKETTLLVYQPYAEDLVTVARARAKNIRTITLGEFNKFILELEKSI